MSDLPILDERYKPQDGERESVDLDERLDKILLHFADQTLDRDAPHMREVASESMQVIKQAFIDDGWSPPVEYDKPPEQMFGEPVLLDPSKQIAAIPITLMTGQDWYDRAIENFRLDLFARGVTAGTTDYNNLMGQFSSAANCGAPAYHLSTVNDHPISTTSSSGVQRRQKTLLIRCRRGHTLKDVRQYETDVLEQQ